MTRVKRGVNANRKRKKLLARTKGFLWGRKSKERLAREALLHAGNHAFSGRKIKKRDYRALWHAKISASAKQENLSFSVLMSKLKKSNIALDKKMLATIAEHHPWVFTKITSEIK